MDENRDDVDENKEQKPDETKKVDKKDEKVGKNKKKMDDETDEVSTSGRQIADINVILDIIGGIKYAIAEQSIKTSNFVTDKVIDLATYCEIQIELVEGVALDYTVWNDLANENVYVLNKPLYQADFNSCDTFVEDRLRCRERIIQDSKTMLREPKTSVAGDRLVYDPKSVGIDVESLYAIRIDDDERQIINLFCRKGKSSGCFAKVRTRTDKRVAELRQRLCNYSKIDMKLIAQFSRSYIAICIEQCQEATKMAKNLNAWQQPLPFCDPFLRAGIFDNMLRAPQLRFEYAAALFAPDIRLSPIPFGDMMRIATISVTKASFVNDFVQQTFKPEWAEPISCYVSSWLSLGDLLIELDGSDVTDDQALKAVVTSAMFLASVVYDSKGIYSNTTLTSIRAATRRIYDWAVSKQIITRANAAPDDDGLLTLLSNSSVKGRNSYLKTEDLQNLGGKGGIAGASVGATLQLHDRDPLRLLFPGIAVRRNVAIDIDDYRDYASGEVDYRWPLEDSINNLMKSHSDLTPYCHMVATMLVRLRSFYVRLNEYMRIAHFSIFARSDASLRVVRSEKTASLVVHMKSMMFTFMSRSWPTDERFQQKYSCIQRLKMMSGFNATMVDTSLRLKLIDAAYDRMSVLDVVTTSTRLELACQKYAHLSYIFDLLKSVRDEKSLRDLLTADFCTTNAFYTVFDDIDVLSENSLVKDGIMPEFMGHYLLNRVDDEVIKAAIDKKVFVHNFNDFADQDLIEVEYKNVRTAFMRHYLRSLLYMSHVVYYKFKILVPYVINHSLPAANGDVLIQAVNLQSSELNLRKCLRVSPLTISLVLVDARDYSVPDTYITNPFMLECAFPPTKYMNQIVMRRSDFIRTLLSSSVVEDCIVGSNFSFASVLSLDPRT